MKFKNILLLSLILLTLSLLSCSDDESNNPVYGETNPSATFILSGQGVRTELPNYVYLPFQVNDANGKPITNLTIDDFKFTERRVPINPIISAPKIFTNDDLPYAFKTVLMIDNSANRQIDLALIKEAANSFVDSLAYNQQIAIVAFSDTTELLQDFTTDIQALKNAINSIQVQNYTMNMYGSVLSAATLWEDVYSPKTINPGFIVLVTGSNDNTNAYSIYETNLQLNHKQIYAISIGNDFNYMALDSLDTEEYIELIDASELTAALQVVQNKMVNWADNYYLYSYMSELRGYYLNIITLSLNVNENITSDGFVEDRFLAHSFYSIDEGVFINSSADKPFGVDSLEIGFINTSIMKAVTFYGDNIPRYKWSTTSSHITMEISGLQNEILTAISTNVIEPNATITLVDEANNFSQTIAVSSLMLEPIHVIETSGTPNGIAVRDNFAYIADYSEGFKIFDITDKTKPDSVGYFSTWSSTRDVFLLGNFAYVANWTEGLTIIDISDPANAQQTGGFNTCRSPALFVRDTLAFMADNTCGLTILSVADSSNPTFISRYDSVRYSFSLDVVGDYVYLADFSGGLKIIDISDPANPIRKSTINPGLPCYDVKVRGNYAYVAVEQRGISIVDISNPSAPFVVSSKYTPGSAYEIVLDGDIAYIADYYGGVSVLDISNPNSIKILDNFDTGDAYSIYIDGNYLYVADMKTGLHIFHTAY